MSQNRKPIRFVLVYIGLLFFFNPYFAVIDFLPDLIGCGLIVLGLLRAVHLNQTLRDARVAFLRLMLVDVVKTVMMLIAFGSGNNERPTSLLLVAFCATVIELFFAIPAITKLFEGLSTLATLEECLPMYEARRGGFSRLELLQKRTVCFFFLKEIFCLLPEFSALSLSSNEDTGMIRMYEFIGVLRVLAFLVVLVLGIVWLVRLTVVFKRFWREKEFFARIETKYREYFNSHPGLVVQRRYFGVFLLFFAGMLLLADFYMDFRNVIPDAAGTLLLLVGLCFTDLPYEKRLVGGGLCALYGVVATISASRAYAFSTTYSISSINKLEAAADAYFSMWMTSFFEMLAFLALLGYLLWSLRTVIDRWAGYLPEQTQTEFDARSRKNFLEGFDARLLRMLVLGFFSALASFFFDYFKQIPNTGIFRLMEYFWLVDFCLSLLFAVLFGNLLSHIFEEIKNRFQYD